MDHLADRGVTLEVVVTSNVQTGATSSRAQHQLAALLTADVRVALCTGNPTVSDTRLTREYELAANSWMRHPWTSSGKAPWRDA